MTAISTRPEVISPPTLGRVVLQLARFDGRRLLRHPLTWIGALASLGMMWLWMGGRAPILPRDSVYLAGATMPLAGTTFLAAFYASLRDRANPEMLASYQHGRNVRLCGIQLGLLGPVFLALLLEAVGLVYLLAGGPIGEITWVELAGGPAMVAALGSGGVLLGRFLPHPIVAPVALLGLGMLQFLASPDAQISSGQPTANFEWLAPWIVPSAFEPVEEFAGRPGFLHLGYLLAVTMMFALLVLVARGRPRVFQLVLAVIVVGGLVRISMSLPGEDPFHYGWSEAADAQVCVNEEGVEYCAFEFYEDWIPAWQETVAAVDALFPVAIDAVIQRPHNIGWGVNSGLPNDGVIALTTLEWDRAGAAPDQAFGLALASAQSALGLPPSRQVRVRTPEEIDSIVAQNPDYPELRQQLESEQPALQFCSATGQARAVVAAWLAGAALTDGSGRLEAAIERSRPSPVIRIAGPAHTPGAFLDVSDAELAQDLLKLPVAEVRAQLEERWAQVTRTATTSAELASWFGLPGPGYEESGFFQEPCL